MAHAPTIRALLDLPAQLGIMEPAAVVVFVFPLEGDVDACVSVPPELAGWNRLRNWIELDEERHVLFASVLALAGAVDRRVTVTIDEPEPA